MKRLMVLLVALALASGGAWLVAGQLESPEQAAARAEPPPPDPVVAPLDEGYLHGSISISMTAQMAESAVVKAPDGLQGVVTSVERGAGVVLTPGSPVYRVNGRPVFALSGSFALYRDIYPGDSGDDVKALQLALQGAGYSVGKADGNYGALTQQAVREMYQRSRYSVPESTAPSDEPSEGAREGSPEAVPERSAKGTPDDSGAGLPEASGEGPPEGSGPGVPEGSAEGAPEGAPVAGRVGAGLGAVGAPEGAPAAGRVGVDLPQPGSGAPRPPGPVVLRSEVLMVPRLPATVASAVPVGGQVAAGTDLLTLASGDVILTTRLPTESLGPLAVGAQGHIVDSNGTQIAAQISTIAESAESEVQITATADGALVPGTPYLVTVENPAAEDGLSILAPASAVVTRGGVSYVYVRVEDAFDEVQVEVVGSVGGVVSILPVDPLPAVAAGTEVRIG
jgi:peptidoglycan hydrolase-like protein with peptidoglycan-binding domain